MSPRIAAIEKLLETRAKRDKRVAVLYGAAIAFLVAAVLYVVYSDYQQDQQLRSVSVCATEPRSPECARGHANSVALTTPAEACFILAQGGKRCTATLPEAPILRRKLVNSIGGTDTVKVTVNPEDNSVTYAPTPANPNYAGPSDQSGSSSVPRPPRSPSLPAPPAQPQAPTAPSPEPAPPAQPAKQAPVVDAPDQLGLCVNALGISVICYPPAPPPYPFVCPLCLGGKRQQRSGHSSFVLPVNQHSPGLRPISQSRQML